MALSKMQKGLFGLAVALVAVVAVGYAGLRYLENAVVEAVRTWAAQTPEGMKVQLGDVIYSLPKNRLVLKDARIDYMYASPSMYARIVNALTVMDKWTTATQSPYVSNFYDPSDHRPILADFELKQ